MSQGAGQKHDTRRYFLDFQQSGLRNRVNGGLVGADGVDSG